MCMKLQALGFACDGGGSTAKIIAKLAAKATRSISCSKGEYRVWRSAGGAELWFHYPHGTSEEAAPRDAAGKKKRAGQMMGLTPFHRGSSDIKIRVERALVPDRLNPLEGTIRASLRVPDAPGPHPQLQLEMVPFALQRRSRRPFMAKAQIVGFAHDVRAFESETDYLSATPALRLIPAGSICAVRKSEVAEFEIAEIEPDYALGLVTGTIERSQRLVNPVSGAPYYWLVLRTDAGLIDIVTAPASVNGDVSEGHVAQVCASFVGRLRGTPIK